MRRVKSDPCMSEKMENVEYELNRLRDAVSKLAVDVKEIQDVQASIMPILVMMVIAIIANIAT